MKEKLKIFMFNSFIFYVVIVIILTIFNILNFTSEIELNNNEENNKDFFVLKEKVKQLQNNSCKTLLTDMIDTYDKTSYDGSVNLSDFYDMVWNGTSFLQYYTLIEEKCGISIDDMKNIDLHKESLNSILYTENLLAKYMFQYEIGLTDYYMRDIGEANIINMQYQLSKSSELKIIENVLDYIGGNND